VFNFHVFETYVQEMHTSAIALSSKWFSQFSQLSCYQYILHKWPTSWSWKTNVAHKH